MTAGGLSAKAGCFGSEEERRAMPGRDRTPMRCPLCDGRLDHIQIRNLGDVTAHILWQMHTGECPNHGWFQAELVGKPPREIFPVTRPAGNARAVNIDGQDIFAFPTVWNSMDTRQKVDPLDPRYWQIDWQRIGVSARGGRR
jgi:hypothetical protein